MKKVILTFLLGMALTFSTVLGYSTIKYVMNKTVEENVTVGETVKTDDGVIISLIEYDDYSLTYFDLDETSTQRHYLTYTYSYEIVTPGMELSVSSLSDDIEISSIDYDSSTVSITFSLNQTKTFNKGDVLHIKFYFEAIEISLGVFTASNPLNINDATKEELMSIGLSSYEAAVTLDTVCVYTLTSVIDWDTRSSMNVFASRYQYYEDLGIIVFE